MRTAAIIGSIDKFAPFAPTCAAGIWLAQRVLAQAFYMGPRVRSGQLVSGPRQQYSSYNVVAPGVVQPGRLPTLYISLLVGAMLWQSVSSSEHLRAAR